MLKHHYVGLFLFVSGAFFIPAVSTARVEKFCGVHLETILAAPAPEEVTHLYIKEFPGINISQELLATFSNLEVLHITHSSLLAVAIDFFSAAPRLRELSLAHNHISFLSDDCVAGWPQLRSLDLRNNDLTELPDSLRETAPHLATLLLSGNDALPASKEWFAALTCGDEVPYFVRSFPVSWRSKRMTNADYVADTSSEWAFAMTPEKHDNSFDLLSALSFFAEQGDGNLHAWLHQQLGIKEQPAGSRIIERRWSIDTASSEEASSPPTPKTSPGPSPRLMPAAPPPVPVPVVKLQHSPRRYHARCRSLSAPTKLLPVTEVSDESGGDDTPTPEVTN
ncbi:MAG: leucine-rich repeat domain-containing protein [Candidatus Dependentiae bacterium]|jgi:hypothetical protein